MKRKNGYLMTELGDTCYAVAAEDAADCPNVLVTMNRVGSVIWKLLEEEITAHPVFTKGSSQSSVFIFFPGLIVYFPEKQASRMMSLFLVPVSLIASINFCVVRKPSLKARL